MMEDVLETPETRSAIETAEIKARRDIREEPVYLFGGRSYYRDLALAEERIPSALARLERHTRQMREASRHRELRTPDGAQFEYRVNPNTETGHGGEFTPPAWINELFASIPRSSQVVQRLAPRFDLPAGVDSVNLPRMTQGTQTKVQVPGQPVDDRDVTTTGVKSPASTFTGMSDWALQSLDQSPQGAHLDWVVFKDLTESLDSKVEKLIVNGTGENEQFYGLINLPANNRIEYTEAVEVAKVLAALGKTIATTGIKRHQPPEAILMNTSRYAWQAFTADTERPEVFTDMVGREFPIASLGGFAVYLDDAIEAELGTSKEEDTIIVCRPSDFVLFYSQPKTSVMLDVLSGTLQARFRMHQYVAAILGRYPSGVSYMIGSGMKPATGYH